MSWYDNGVLIAVIMLDADLAGYHAALTTSSLTVGNHTITSVYSGDSNFSGSSASLTEFISS